MEVLPTLPEKSVHVCITSPPYFALRSYLPKDHADKHREIGSEPTPEAFISTMVAVFREVRRVLRDDGVLWMNLGDGYGQSGGNGEAGSSDGAVGRGPRSKRCGKELSGQLQNMPHRVAEALRSDGWIWRQTVVWQKRSPMPESVGGWRWQRCRVKVEGQPKRQSNQTATQYDRDHSGGVTNAARAEYADCPGCPKCSATGGYVLRRGSGRCTTAHEYVFLLTKTARYFWDGEASKEATTLSVSPEKYQAALLETGNAWYPRARGNNLDPSSDSKHGRKVHGIAPPGGRNPRSVWTISSEPSSEKHFAAFPSELVRRCLASSPAAGGVCSACGAPWAPVVDLGVLAPLTKSDAGRKVRQTRGDKDRSPGDRDDTNLPRHHYPSQVRGYRPTCGCNAPKTGPVILDPFGGTGTVAQTARHRGCRGVYIDLNPAYVEIAKRRIPQPPRWWIRQEAKAKGRKAGLKALKQLETLFAMEGAE
jgi:DNA modification methylase